MWLSEISGNGTSGLVSQWYSTVKLSRVCIVTIQYLSTYDLNVCQYVKLQSTGVTNYVWSAITNCHLPLLIVLCCYKLSSAITNCHLLLLIVVCSHGTSHGAPHMGGTLNSCCIYSWLQSYAGLIFGEIFQASLRRKKGTSHVGGLGVVSGHVMKLLLVSPEYLAQ